MCCNVCESTVSQTWWILCQRPLFCFVGNTNWRFDLGNVEASTLGAATNSRTRRLMVNLEINSLCLLLAPTERPWNCSIHNSRELSIIHRRPLISAAQDKSMGGRNYNFIVMSSATSASLDRRFLPSPLAVTLRARHTLRSDRKPHIYNVAARTEWALRRKSLSWMLSSKFFFKPPIKCSPDTMFSRLQLPHKYRYSTPNATDHLDFITAYYVWMKFWMLLMTCSKWKTKFSMPRNLKSKSMNQHFFTIFINI